MPMNPTIKAQWCAALNGGGYTPGSYDMCRNGSQWSVLGVLMDVVDPSHWDMGLPPPHAKENANAIYAAAQISQPQMVEVTNMQRDGKSFAEIAAHIQANY